MCYDDGDGAEVWIEATRKARKPYTCCECNGPIPPGAKYVCISGIQDHEPFRYHAHAECMELWHFTQNVVCGGNGMIMIGGLREELHQYDTMGDVGYWTNDDNDWIGPDLESLLDEVRDHYTSRTKGDVARTDHTYP